MDVTFLRGKKEGAFILPPDKSEMIRALLCATLSGKKTDIFFGGGKLSDDVMHAVTAVRALGAEVTFSAGKISIICEKLNRKKDVFSGESATLYSFLYAISEVFGLDLNVIPEGTLTERIRERRGGIKVTDDMIIVDNKTSSQSVSGAVIANSFSEKKRKIVLKNELVSEKYVRLTEKIVKIIKNENKIIINDDLSFGETIAAANMLGNKIEGNNLLIPENYDAAENPDFVFSAAILAACKNNGEETFLKNTGRLKLKESDREVGVVSFINGLGGKAEIVGENIKITGTEGLSGGTVDALSDHRRVFAAWLASTVSSGDITVTGAEAVSKSFPDFIEQAEKLCTITKEKE